MNPNDYDDAAFLAASNEFQGNAAEMFESLWAAGADASNIIDEINNALVEAGINNSTGSGPLTLTESHG